MFGLKLKSLSICKQHMFPWSKSKF